MRGEGKGIFSLGKPQKKKKALGIVGHCKSSTEACFEVKLGRGSYAL